ncbi:hypothetical protein PR202_ga23907 [Eleusine coracana subsp. coracana]|uniref:Rx N-terminal domain-containing protein n=1 Tax=Eleusine coracana subsp. coracana TaxID=191504 RepID=A0AAV5D7S3_ELECO|nr:hypothetical protein PR202_ga23907 [Eleusine coracana subsp. coracana]
MDALLSAVASDLIGRLISFFIRKYHEHGGTDTTNVTVRLQRALVRARVVVEEAEGRQIANRAMLQQLNQLRQQLCRAAYALETFRWRATDPRRSRRRSHTMVSESTRPVESLEATLSDMREFVMLLNSCPRVIKQPYSAYLFTENCMFGRQMEKEEIIGFLSKPLQDLDILPIIGPLGVGKWTLVEHVCLDERVRERFTKIHRLRSDGLDYLHSHNEHRHRSLFDFTERSLIMIDMVDGDAAAEESWRTFHSAVLHRRAHRGSKIIIISRTEAHSSLGTVRPLRLHPLHREELWYFFKNLVFGAANPDEHPDLVRIAMAMCSGISDIAPFADANIIATSLRANLSARSWHHVLKMGAKAMVLQLDAASNGLHKYNVGRYYLCRPLKDPSVPCLFYNGRKLTGVAHDELPKVTMRELRTSDSPPLAGETRFDVLVWQSHIAPYASYVATCEIDRAHYQQVVALKKRLLNKRRRDHQEDDSTNIGGSRGWCRWAWKYPGIQPTYRT